AAAAYLESVGFIRRENHNWLFFHQTLFDYCYARRFVAQSRSLSEEILQGSQGLFERSQMVQLLAYLRGAEPTRYHHELTTLLFSDNLRIHLRLLLIGWFGNIPDPTPAELQIAQRLMRTEEDQSRFFNAIGGNGGWFDQLKPAKLTAMLRSQDETEINLAVGLLMTLINSRTEEVLTFLQPYLGRSEAWDKHISLCLTNLKHWHSEAAVSILTDLFQRRRTFNRDDTYLYNLRANPAAGCQILRVYLDGRLDDLLTPPTTKPPDSDSNSPPPSSTQLEHYLLGEYAVGELLKQAGERCPDQLLLHLLPWFIRAATTLTQPPFRKNGYPTDMVFGSFWYSNHIGEGATFAWQIVAALKTLAAANPTEFRELAAALAEVETLSVQRVLVAAYLSRPATYANDIYAYLIADPRRLNIGEPLESPHYDSRRLFAAVFPHLNQAQRRTLEEIILQIKPAWEFGSAGSYGITQWRFLKNIPIELLSPKAQKRHQELANKFPDFELHPPQGVTGGWVGPPIEQEAQSKMSDEAWLGAMRKYGDETESRASRPNLLEGGVLQLSRSFTEQVKQDPARFYQLAQRFDETISLHYVTAVITGVAESDAPPEWVFELVRRFAQRLEGDFRRYTCWALSKRAEDEVPDDLLDLLTDWALHDPDPNKNQQTLYAGDQPPDINEQLTIGINTNRGAAIRTLCHCIVKRTPPQFERGFALLEEAANDLSTAVRTCVLDVLGPFLNQDADRTLTIFERAMAGHPALLNELVVHRFLSWTYRRHFKRIEPFIAALFTQSDDNTRQAGARLACLAAFFHKEANGLAQQARTGTAMMRRGAARVYARNLEEDDLRETCQKYLLQLMNDSDEEVRKQVGWCFRYVRAEQLADLRPFITAFLNSPALLLGANHLLEYLNPLAAAEPELALAVTRRILEGTSRDLVDFRRPFAMVERELVRLPLTVYNHTLAAALKEQAMDLFEEMLVRNGRLAHQALADWDRH
ncbi:MAG: hypothetical protein KDE56_16465, partial [Anaerolineales bacterium]|nr:hypothetical protein [Anaerolineales bacterium]